MTDKAQRSLQDLHCQETQYFTHIVTLRSSCPVLTYKGKDRIYFRDRIAHASEALLCIMHAQQSGAVRSLLPAVGVGHIGHEGSGCPGDSDVHISISRQQQVQVQAPQRSPIY